MTAQLNAYLDTRTSLNKSLADLKKPYDKLAAENVELERQNRDLDLRRLASNDPAERARLLDQSRANAATISANNDKMALMRPGITALEGLIRETTDKINKIQQRLNDLTAILNQINARIAEIQQNIDQNKPATPAVVIPILPIGDPLAVTGTVPMPGTGTNH